MSTEYASSKHSPLLAGTGAFALLWVVARAAVQSMTIDESDSFLAYVVRPMPSGWDASANNHVLNSLLMRLVCTVFGWSPLSIRLPALIGAAIYIGAAYFLVRFLSKRVAVQWPLYACLVFSPFVMDYQVAGRGYSLALGFLICAIALACRHAESGSASLARTAALISVSAALSFCANFSFAVVDAVTVLLLIWWIGRRSAEGYLKTLGAFILPGLAVTYFFAGTVLPAWPKGQFTWGVASLPETGHSILDASLYEPNPYLLNPRLQHYFVHFGRLLYPLLGVFFVWRVVKLWRGRTSIQEPRARRLAGLAWLCGAALALTLCGHQVLYWVYGIPLPLSRTGLYIAPLCLLMAGAAAVIPLPSLAGRASGSGILVMLALIACYSLGCLRLTYFKEWKYDADMKKVYSILAYYNRAHGVTDVLVNWRYMAALNCYREMSGRETFHQIAVAPSEAGVYQPGFPAYVVFYRWDGDFVKREGLKVVYHDGFSDAAVAIRPEVETAQPPCPR